MKKLENVRQKQTLILRTDDSALFEEARFTLRDRLPPGGDSEMIREATRILALGVSNAGTRQNTGRRKPPSAFFYFVSGICCGLVFVAAAAAILAFFR